LCISSYRLLICNAFGFVLAELRESVGFRSC
jgi:hypothetical protein